MCSESQQAVRADGRHVDDGNGPQGRQPARDDAAAPQPPALRVAERPGPEPHAQFRPASPSAAPSAARPPTPPPPTPKPPPATAHPTPTPAQPDQQQQQHEQSAKHGARQATDERFHGVVPRPEEENGSREPKDAQFRNFETSGCRVEITERNGETAFYRRGEEIARGPHERTPGLQVQTQEKDQDAFEERQVPVGYFWSDGQFGSFSDGGFGGSTSGH